jgi:hypothetical protein
MAPAPDMSAAAPDNKKETLTARDLEILSAAWNCMKTQPEVSLSHLAFTFRSILPSHTFTL